MSLISGYSNIHPILCVCKMTSHTTTAHVENELCPNIDVFSTLVDGREGHNC
jgi:hypothetical protein